MEATDSLTEDQLTIAQAAERTGLSAHTLRYYERAGLLLRVERDGSSGHRRYRERDIEWINLCTKLRATGMPIRRIRDYADLVRAGEGNEAERLEILEAHRADVVAQLAELEGNLALIDYKLGLYRDAVACRNGRPSGNGQPAASG